MASRGHPLGLPHLENDVAYRTPYPLFLEVETVQGRPGKEFMESSRLCACLELVEFCGADDDNGVSTPHGDTLRSARRGQAYNFTELRLGLGESPSHVWRSPGLRFGAGSLQDAPLMSM